MKPITISPDDTLSYNDFSSGNSIQVRLDIKDSELKSYAKNKTIKVIHLDEELTGKIVSDPLVVSPDSETGHKVVSLIVEKIR